MGPIDVVDDGFSGVLDVDLEQAVSKALELKREDAIAHAAKFTWRNTARILFEQLVDLNNQKVSEFAGSQTPIKSEH